MARNQPADPIGTPPEGGRWTWNGSAWVRVPEAQVAHPQPIQPDAAPAAQEE